MKTKIKSPNQCTLNELNLFESLILDGGEVQAQGLSSRIKLAHKLIFIYTYNQCVAIGSVKNPLESYKTKLFKNVGYENLQHLYNYELGWLYVPISKRGNGYGNHLIKTVSKVIEHEGCFATTREDNVVMQHLLQKYGFKKLGKSYPSSRGDYLLNLFVIN